MSSNAATKLDMRTCSNDDTKNAFIARCLRLLQRVVEGECPNGGLEKIAEHLESAERVFSEVASSEKRGREDAEESGEAKKAKKAKKTKKAKEAEEAEEALGGPVDLPDDLLAELLFGEWHQLHSTCDSCASMQPGDEEDSDFEPDQMDVDGECAMCNSAVPWTAVVLFEEEMEERKLLDKYTVPTEERLAEFMARNPKLALVNGTKDAYFLCSR